MEAARRAREHGFAVTLLERRADLGGATALAATGPALGHFRRLVAWYERALEAAGVDVRLETPATSQLLATLEPTAVVVATGAVEAPPVLDGYDVLPAWLAGEALEGRRSSLDTPLPGTVCVLGAGQRALATAAGLAARGIETSVLAAGRVGTDTSGLARRAMIDRLRRTGVTIHTGRPVGLTADGVAVTDADGRPGLIACQGVVVAEPLRAAPAELEVPGVELLRVGDAREPRDIGAAIAEARDTIDTTARQVAPPS